MRVESRRRAAKTSPQPPRGSPRIVREVMSRRPASIQAEETVGLAHQQMLWLGVRHLPVLRGEQVVGILSDRDVLGALALHGKTEGARVKIQEVMRTPVQSVGPGEPIEDVAARLAALRIGCLPVLEQGKLLGIVTTIDLLSDRSMGPIRRDSPVHHAATAREVMTAEPTTVGEEETIVDAAAAMAEKGIRHLPVVDGAGRLVGMLSDRDIRAALGDPIEALRERRTAEERTVETVMVSDPVRVQLDSPVGEVAETLVSERIGAVPVVDDRDRPVGIVSYVDLLAWLAQSEKEARS